MQTNKLIEQLIAKTDLSREQMQQFMQACMRGELSDAEIAAFLVLLRAKGETVEELTTAATVMMQSAHCIALPPDLVDIVGTGGDGRNTFNISTVSSFVAAAAGAKVAKHGARSASSQSGSADLLLAAGFELLLSDADFLQCLTECGICFLFAPHFHHALQQVKNARQQLKIRTFFNLLGPLLNPAQVKRLVVGVSDAKWLRPLAEVLVHLGKERVFLINSRDGLDEVSVAAPTDVVEFNHGQWKNWHIDPKTYGLSHPNLEGIVIESPEQSLNLSLKVLNGEPGPARDIVLLNAAAALFCAGTAQSYEDALQKAAFAIDSGEAKKRFDRLKNLTQQLKAKA
ncbi:MAG: anthranilate phosphoribosyltransferase [Tatlockia sp.]